MTMPKKVRIGPFNYKLTASKKRANDATLKYGHCDVAHCEILLNPDQNKQALKDTVLHEILHAAIDLQGLFAAEESVLTGNDGEELLVRGLSPILLQIMRDNPQLVEWLVS